ncbi:YecA family protein [Alteribacillus iranensis]|uniref:Helix-turn-helix, Psq domain n=1 Tax=Alteribacillus iranensis TaxID=930128 RepID=A0A1I2BM25_9BACI|nr:SEC-C domain-containing protein [Alteribacillus iranensis]SFE57049.1 helix-turn-helix, Psq domain [Alteribacillus iranensis]
MAVGRNEPCPCGSGKKYKKCCMNKVTSITYTGKDITWIQGQSFQYIMNHSPASFQHYMADSLEEEAFIHLNDESETQLFTLLYFGHYLLERGDEEMKLLADAPIWNVKQRHLLKSWQHQAVFSLFQLEEWSGSSMQATDLASGKSYQVELPSDYPPGPAGLGFLGLVPVQGKWFAFGVPYMIVTRPERETAEMEKYDVFVEAFQLSARDAYQRLEKEEKEKLFPALLNDYFSHLREERLASEEDTSVNQNITADHSWSEDEQDVFRLFTEKAEPELRENNGIAEAEKTWVTFCSQTSPVIRKKEVFAAALEYYVGKHSLALENVTQKKLAEKYDVSPTTISKRVRDIDAVLSDALDTVGK